MKVLFAPVGIYYKRVLRGITSIKPDKIYLLVTELVKPPKDEYQRILYEKWKNTTENFAKEIINRIKVFYPRYPEDKSIELIPIDTDDYLAVFKEILWRTLQLKREYEELYVYLDMTSATASVRSAIMVVSTLLDNVYCIYTPYSKRPMPDQYPKRAIEDKGGETIVLPTPKIDFYVLMRDDLKNVLIIMKTKFQGTVTRLRDLIEALGIEVSKANMIRIGKLIKKLEKYGCVVTRKIDRKKEVSLTLIGAAIAEVLGRITS